MYAYIYFLAGISLLAASAIYFKNAQLADSLLWFFMSAVFLALGYSELMGKKKSGAGK